MKILQCGRYNGSRNVKLLLSHGTVERVDGSLLQEQLFEEGRHTPNVVCKDRDPDETVQPDQHLFESHPSDSQSVRPIPALSDKALDFGAPHSCRSRSGPRSRLCPRLKLQNTLIVPASNLPMSFRDRFRFRATSLRPARLSCSRNFPLRGAFPLHQNPSSTVLHSSSQSLGLSVGGSSL